MTHPARRIIASLFTVFAVSGTPGCEAPTTSDTPVQSVEADIDDDTLELLMATADLDPAADYVVYEVLLDGNGGDEIRSSRCPFEDEITDSTCGYCACDQSGRVYCVDFQCDNGTTVPLSADSATEGLDALGEDDATCAAEDAGRSWGDDCNVCTCRDNGMVTCTRMSCDVQNPR